MKNLKNYTSTVPASRSIMNIEKCLVDHGAKQIARTYEGGVVTGIKFVMDLDGRDVVFSLPAKVDNCKQVFISQRVNEISDAGMKRILEQAERTAWRIIRDWIEIQMAMIDLEQIEMAEVFLAYVFNPQTNQTFFEMMKEDKFKALPGGN